MTDRTLMSNRRFGDLVGDLADTSRVALSLSDLMAAAKHVDSQASFVSKPGGAEQDGTFHFRDGSSLALKGYGPREIRQ